MEYAMTGMTRILVVEDHAELQQALRINLQARRYDVMAALTRGVSLVSSRAPFYA